MLRESRTDDPETLIRIDGVLRGYFELQGLEHYRKAYALRIAVDSGGEPTYQVDSQVSAKAGAEILSVLGQRPEAGHVGEAGAIETALIPLAEKQQRLMMMPQ